MFFVCKLINFIFLFFLYKKIFIKVIVFIKYWLLMFKINFMFEFKIFGFLFC